MANGKLVVTNGDRWTADAALRNGKSAANKNRDLTDASRTLISKDRPVYCCPKCSESAMQFYATLERQSDRTDFFHCHACGTFWEI